MQNFGATLTDAVWLILTGDADLLEIIGLSLRVTLTAVTLACLIGLPLGAAVGAFRFVGRGAVAVMLNAAMGLPPVVVGLGLYLALSASGPLGALQLLYTPGAMIAAQAVLVTPIIALLWDARFSLMTVALAGFGRAAAEVGAVIIVGGNINHVTRVMTTAIALETSKGNLELAMALGAVLLFIALAVNAAVMAVKASAVRAAYA
jgi:tungstate transport system permease protein